MGIETAEIPRFVPAQQRSPPLHMYNRTPDTSSVFVCSFSWFSLVFASTPCKYSG